MLLLTRPQDDSQALAAELSAAGHKSFIEPMLVIEPLPIAADAPDADLVIVSSRHAVKALAHYGRCREVLVVGSETARCAEEAGMRVITSLPDVDSLRKHIEKHVPPAKNLLYLRGAQVSADLEGQLRAAGHTIHSYIVYRARAASALSPALLAHLEAGDVTGALFFSRRSAQTYAALTIQAGLARTHRCMRAFCLSRAVADALHTLPFTACQWPDFPDRAHLLGIINNA